MARILVIDDDGIVRQTIAQLVEQAGYAVSTAEDGRCGFDAFQREQPDLVIIDAIMPERQGLETFARIRAANPGAKVIVISGGGRMGNTDPLQAAQALGADEVIAKPFDPDHFLSCINRVLTGG